jgi:hypothetical protein
LSVVCLRLREESTCSQLSHIPSPTPHHRVRHPTRQEYSLTDRSIREDPGPGAPYTDMESEPLKDIGELLASPLIPFV